jgi:transketolase
MKNENQVLDQLCINTIRTLAIDSVQAANSGHPGMPMGTAPMAYVLWMHFLRHNPVDPRWMNRDRFILSAGHGSMLLYALLHLTGYDLPLDELKRFRQLDSKTPGHPEFGHTAGVETTTGPLGQGFSNGIGMAIAEKYLQTYFNRPGFKILDYRIFGIVSDGDLMEGVSGEAASLAGHLKLDNIIYLYDDNRITIDGETALSFSEDVAARFKAYGWHVEEADGNDLQSVQTALERCIAEKEKPSLIRTRTNIGYGSPNKQDTAEVHGAPLGDEEVKLTKQAYGWVAEEPFYIPEAALDRFRQTIVNGKKEQQAWEKVLKEYEEKHPKLSQEFNALRNGTLTLDWEKILPSFSPKDGKIATRQASGKVLNSLSDAHPFLIGGSADLTPSNNTKPQNGQNFSADNRRGRYIRFGVREHAMGALMNGLALSHLRPYGGTFLIFSDYMRPTIRLAALMKIPVVYVFTHDSIGLGEDGPTHQPIEQLPALRAIPNLTIIRPADANETARAWKIAMERTDGPTAILLTRQGLPVIDRTVYAGIDGVERGGYILAGDDNPEIILIATGSEVSITLEAYESLKKEGIAARVVNLASWELFEQQPSDYRESVFPRKVRARLAVEAAAPFGWERYTGIEGRCLGINRYGASAPVKDVMKAFGFTPENIVKNAKELLTIVRKGKQE